MIIKAALLKVQNDTVALVMAPAEFVTNYIYYGQQHHQNFTTA